MDALANFAYGVVATAPSPATSGTSLVLQSGQGAAFPAAPFDVTMWPASVIPLNSNAEIARCTVISGDTLTITRAQYGTTAQPVAIGFQVCQSIDVNLINQLAIRLVPRAAGPVTAATYTVPANELTPFDTTSNAITATLPTAPPDGTVVGLKIVTLGAGHSVTFNCAGSDVFNKTGGSTTGTLSLLAQAVYMQYKASGAIWYVVGDDLPLSQLDNRYVGQNTGSAFSISGTPSVGQVPTATGGSAASWQSLTFNTSTALNLTLAETITYPPTSPTKANSAIYVTQNATLSALPPVSAATSDGAGLMTFTFASSILGTLGSASETFTCYTINFTAAGFNVGTALAPVTATITSATTITVPGGPVSATATVLGTVQPLAVWYTDTTPVNGLFAPRALSNVEGSYTFNAPPSNLYGLGPIVQNFAVYKSGTPVTAAFTLSNVSSNVTLTGTPPVGIYVNMNVVDVTTPANIPPNTIVGSITYNIGGNTTTVGLVNKVSNAAVTPANSVTDTLAFANDVLSPEQVVMSPINLGVQSQQSGVPGSTGIFSGLTTLVVSSSTGNFGATGSGVITTGGVAYPVAWTGNTYNSGAGTNTLTGVTFTGPQTTAVSSGAGTFTVNGQETWMAPPGFVPDEPGWAQGWAIGYWVGPLYNGVKNVKEADFLAWSFLTNSEMPFRMGYQFQDAKLGAGSTVGMQVGMPIGWMVPGYTCTTNSSANGTALSSLASLATTAPFGVTGAQLQALLPVAGSFTIQASDGVHVGNYTGLSNSGNTVTFTGCTYTGNQAATARTGGLVATLPYWMQPHNSAENVGVLNAGATAYPSQAPATTIASASHGLLTSKIGTTTGTVDATSAGVSLTNLSNGGTPGTFTVDSVTNWGTAGIGVVRNTSTFAGYYVFSWTSNTFNGTTNILGGCKFSGLQSATLISGSTVYLGGILGVNSVQYFPDGDGSTGSVTTPGGTLAIDNQNAGIVTYQHTTGTYAIGYGSATTLTTVSTTLNVESTAFLPPAGTGILMTSTGPVTITWTAIASGSSLTINAITSSATIITGSQLFLASVTTGPANYPPASFLGCVYSAPSQDGNLYQGQGVLAMPGGLFQLSTLPTATVCPLCIGPGFQLPPPTASKMTLFLSGTPAAASAATTVPLFTGMTPPFDGTEVRIVNTATSGGILTFTSNASSHGTGLGLGAATRALSAGGALYLGWDSNSIHNGATGEWIEYGFNTGGHA